ncbi:MAG: hypothetical protein Q8N88_01240 [Nanoarchaeota archaeon]|nr:hypothetical protein [Nanoarchaeota archaeon]
MKRGIVILVLIFSFYFVLGQGNSSPSDSSEIIKKFDNSTGDILSREVEIPAYIFMPIQLLLGIEKKISWQNFIIVLGIWFGFFILILSLMDIMPFLNKGILKFLGAIVITLLISITGAINEMANFFFNIAGFFKITERYVALKIFIAIIIALLCVVIFGYLIKILKNKNKIKTAELTGQKINDTVENLKAVDKLNKIRLGENPQ